jgi:CRP/FNR family cyclic AMP-dependent transcriptional regulator
VWWVDLTGYAASALVFLTFYMKDMIALRIVALCSNVAFLIYAGSLDLVPIFILHIALIPINSRRLVCAWREQQTRLNQRAPPA